MRSELLLVEGYMVTAAEAADPNSPGRRAAAGGAAGRDVQRDANALDRTAVQTLVRRLQQLKRELQGVIAAGGTDFRRFTAQSLITEVDRLIADATRDVHDGTRALFSRANSLGIAAVEEPIKGARIAVTLAPRLDAALVTSAFDLTGDLLTEPMQRFRNQVVQGIRRAATIGTSNGYVELAQKIDDAGFDAASFKAERIVRTELSRVLNQATFARLEGLAKNMPFLRKGWRAARDNRTRQGHREARETYKRGSGIPIATPFTINVYQELPGKPPKLLGAALLRFPVDPDATPQGRLAAGATIMCRCNAFVDFDLEDLRAWSTSRSRAVSPDAPPPQIPRGSTPPGFAEPPIGPRKRVPTAAVPKAPKTPAPASALTRKEPARSTIPGGRELLKDYNEKIQTALEDAHRDLMAASRFDAEHPAMWREALQTVNVDGTRSQVFPGGRDYVHITDDVGEAIKKSAVWIHTHPSSSAFSFADVNIMAKYNRAGMAMVVYGRSGSWYELTAPTSFSYQNREFVANTLGQAEREYRVEVLKAVNRAKYRTEQIIPELARERGVSTLQVIAGLEHDQELQDLYELYFQEEAVDALKAFAAKFDLRFRFYLPPAPTTNTKNRSREALEFETTEASRRGGLDDWEISSAANRYAGPGKLSPAERFQIEQLKKLGVEVDATTGERRISRTNTAGLKEEPNE